jgi:mRNA-degrading endonuclease toxin of MazEF toxin-antitoxin module
MDLDILHDALRIAAAHRWPSLVPATGSRIGWPAKEAVMKVVRGDVVLIELPSTSAGSLLRPVLVIQADSLNAVLPTTIVVAITRDLSGVGSDPRQFLIDVNTPDGAGSGLGAHSAVLCGNMFTIDTDRVRRKIGELSGALMLQINDCLRAVLAPP